MTTYTTEEKNELVDWVRGVMETKGWTAVQLAMESGLSPSTLLMLFSDGHTKRFKPATLERIATAADTDLPEKFKRTYH